MPDRDLKLNSLSRYTKTSPRLILEEHGSCEVPAGCGGVILRWRSPEEPISMVLRYFAENGQLAQMTLDGTDLKSSAVMPVQYGSHVLTLEIRDFNPEFAVVLLVGQLNAEDVRILQPEGETTVLSREDGSWKYTLAAPDSAAWQRGDYEDYAWLSMVQKRVNLRPKEQEDRWIREWKRNQKQEVMAQGAEGLGIETGSGVLQRLFSLVGQHSSVPVIYIRKTFAIRRNSRKGE